MPCFALRQSEIINGSQLYPHRTMLSVPHLHNRAKAGHKKILITLSSSAREFSYARYIHQPMTFNDLYFCHIPDGSESCKMKQLILEGKQVCKRILSKLQQRCRKDPLPRTVKRTVWRKTHNPGPKHTPLDTSMKQRTQKRNQHKTQTFKRLSEQTTARTWYSQQER